MHHDRSFAVFSTDCVFPAMPCHADGLIRRPTKRVGRAQGELSGHAARGQAAAHAPIRPGGGPERRLRGGT